MSDLPFKVHHVADTVPFRGWSASQPYIGCIVDSSGEDARTRSRRTGDSRLLYFAFWNMGRSSKNDGQERERVETGTVRNRFGTVSRANRSFLMLTLCRCPIDGPVQLTFPFPTTLPYLHTPHSLVIISSKPTPGDDMAQQPDSPHFQAHFEPALQAYEKKAGVSLAQHPLAIKLQNCDSVEAVTGLLQDQARAFGDLQGSDRIMKSIKTTVSILSKLSSTASLADAFGPVC